jgi:hypothetical protein
MDVQFIDVTDLQGQERHNSLRAFIIGRIHMLLGNWKSC